MEKYNCKRRSYNTTLVDTGSSSDTKKKCSTRKSCKMSSTPHSAGVNTWINSRQYFVFVCCSVICFMSVGVDGGPRRGSYYSDTAGYYNEQPPPQNTDHGYSDPMDQTTYLSRFGYLPRGDMETGAYRSSEELDRATERLQRFAGLPVTGKFDDATRGLFHKPRCGLPDILTEDEYTEEDDYKDERRRRRRHHHGRRRQKRYALGPSQWEKRNLTYRILNYSPDLAVHEVRDTLQRAFKLWSDVTQLNFRETAGEADIKIRFARYYHADGYPFDGPGNILAHAFFPGEEKGGDIHFDEDEVWTLNTHDGTNLYSVAAHELGHSLGLAHSSVVGSLMFPWYQGYTPDLQLHYDDRSIIQYLYGARTPSHEPPPPRGPTPANPPPTPASRPPMVPAIPITPESTPTTTVSPQAPPDACTTSVDAVALIRSEVFIFKGRWFWRRDENGTMAGYPAKFDIFWYGLPKELNRFDAVYERYKDGKIVFFSGKHYWMYNGNYLAPNFTSAGRPITDFGLPRDLERLDAAFVWGHNRRTYFVSGDMYWRLNEDLGRIDYGYPRDMSMWEGMPTPIDAAFTWWDGKTYFFKGQDYWKFNDHRMEVRHGYPKPLGPQWLDCKNMLSVDEPVKRSSALGTSHPPVITVIVGSVIMAALLSSSSHSSSSS